MASSSLMVSWCALTFLALMSVDVSAPHWRAFPRGRCSRSTITHQDGKSFTVTRR
ncbi:hypothetical protein P153DRAFT_366187 [Dothidotthia symphoricarpi CBS 119687]|uniref:Uncharacterized protein n=1 Tax=Dothidotthia symphoricarpi CBS 119687 TaxID=1392245 RepID=A0A6A6AHQ5_9PLEO|nr:uncharacterized protein P153DRAFT_366187 [Dothidotthia symphoricarpi CBS 119687]KAF2130628.1 hypothetical protein P153DRAFT_366187 [Dothidotthia symphoricarpi CBS 119687]